MARRGHQVPRGRIVQFPVHRDQVAPRDQVERIRQSLVLLGRLDLVGHRVKIVQSLALRGLRDPLAKIAQYQVRLAQADLVGLAVKIVRFPVLPVLVARRDHRERIQQLADQVGLVAHLARIPR